VVEVLQLAWQLTFLNVRDDDGGCTISFRLLMIFTWSALVLDSVRFRQQV
jgi:hypothetical protein